MAASLHTLAISAPLYPSVASFSFSQSMFSSTSIPLRFILKSYFLPTAVGNGISRQRRERTVRLLDVVERIVYV